MTLTLREAVPEDAVWMAPRLREEDRQEILAVRPAVLDALLAGISAGPAFVWLADGDPCVLFGCVPLDASTASIWLSGTPAMERHSKPLLRHARHYVGVLNSRWPLLVNSADGRNLLHHRFIKWCGFTFFNTRTVNGLRFIDFARIRGT